MPVTSSEVPNDIMGARLGLRRDLLPVEQLNKTHLAAQEVKAHGSAAEQVMMAPLCGCHCCVILISPPCNVPEMHVSAVSFVA